MCLILIWAVAGERTLDLVSIVRMYVQSHSQSQLRTRVTFEERDTYIYTHKTPEILKLLPIYRLGIMF